jgi:hypothetical protein
MREKSIVPATLVALLVDRDEAVLSLLEAAKLLLVTLEDLPEWRREVCGPVDIVPVEGDQSKEVHNLLIRLRVL